MFGQDHFNSTPQDTFYQHYQPYPSYTIHNEHPFSNQNQFFQQKDLHQDFDFDLLLLSSDTTDNFNQTKKSFCLPQLPIFNQPYDSTLQTKTDQLDHFLNFGEAQFEPNPSFQNFQQNPQQFEIDQFLLNILTAPISKPTDQFFPPTNPTIEPTEQFLIHIPTDSAAEPTQVLVTIPAVDNHDRKSKTLPQETNKQKCKKYREKTKQKKKMLDDELELEMEKNIILERKASILEEKVNKFKKIQKKIAMKQKVNMSAEICQLIFDS